MTQPRTLLAALGFFFAALNACAPTVVSGTGNGGGSSTGDDISTSSDSTSTSIDPSFGANAIVIRYGDIPPVTGDVGSTTTGGGGGPDPDTLLLVISNQPVDCANPWSAGVTCPSWAVYLDLSPDQAAGTVSLASANGFSSESGSNGDGTCWGGGGTFADGNLVIDVIDPSTIQGVLTGTDGSNDFDADGPFNAIRCPSTH